MGFLRQYIPKIISYYLTISLISKVKTATSGNKNNSLVLYNTKRYPVYHRLDFHLDKRYMMSGWNIVFYLDIINIYGRDNIWMYSYQEDGTKKDILQFQVFPVGGITIEF